VGLVAEMDQLEKQGVRIKGLSISESAHLVFPYHRELDEQREILKGKNKIGTTKRGIGPAYGDKAARTGLRLNDLINKDRFEALLRYKIKENNEILRALGAKALNFAKVHADYRAAGDRLAPFVTNTVALLHQEMQRGSNILFEGAQGTFLDIDHGTYPFVTSSNTTAGGACTGSGVAPNRMDRVVGVMKAYTTRVGEGPLLTESAEVADMLHAMGREFGATTGRARRCGWFDSVATRYSAIINGIDEIAVTNLDGLDTVETIKLCVGYRAGLQRVEYIPADIELLAKCEPEYAEFPGWKSDTSRCKTWKDLPTKARNYLRAMAELTGARLRIVSVGPARAQTIFV
jgi:adenylosuccinate synthase